ncbi:MAG: spore germination protein [Clostridia bacterium]|nr:spore germination protein [Clostridia bacterium]
MAIKDRIENIKLLLNNSQDITTRNFICENKTQCGLVFVDSAVDKLLLSSSVIDPLQKFEWTNDKNNDINAIQQKIIAYTSVKTVTTIKEAIKDILNGFCAVLFEDCDTILMVECAKWITRLPSEPPTSAVIHGPREGFVEDVTTNISLLRKRLKTRELKIEQIVIGRETATEVRVCYLNNIVDHSIVEKIVEKLKKIDIDGVIDSSYLASFLGDNRGSLFKQVGTAEKPDIVVAKMLEGRVAIVVDGSPFVLTLPFLYIEDLQSSNDYYLSPAHATFMRFMR